MLLCFMESAPITFILYSLAHSMGLCFSRFYANARRLSDITRGSLESFWAIMSEEEDWGE